MIPCSLKNDGTKTRPLYRRWLDDREMVDWWPKRQKKGPVDKDTFMNNVIQQEIDYILTMKLAGDNQPEQEAILKKSQRVEQIVSYDDSSIWQIMKAE